MRRAMILGISIVGVPAAVATFLGMRLGANLAAEYERRSEAVRQALPARSAEPLTIADVGALPGPVQRYLQRSGAIGKPRVLSFQAAFQAEMFQRPGQKGMPGPVDQFNVVQPPRRLFLMRSRMFGLPVAVLHDCSGSKASMQVRLASLFDAVNRNR